MFVVKKIALFISMILLGYVGEDIEDARPLFISWFIFLLLIVIEYVETYYLKRFQGATKYNTVFYMSGIIIFGFLTFISLMGSFGLIILSEDLFLKPDSTNVIIKGLFLLTFGNNISIDAFMWTAAICVVIFFVGEFFQKPFTSYEEKHTIKYGKKGEAAS